MSAALEVHGITRSFFGVAALRGVRFAVPEGSITGLIGPNGAGKSTLLNVVSGLLRPDGGTVRFLGDEVTGFAPHRLAARGLTRTFQVARGFPRMSVFQHFMLYGPRQPGEGLLQGLFRGAAARRREEELAERALGIARRLRLAPLLDAPVTALSGGQKKLVEIGRTLMAEPRMILLDEPMAGVNPSLGAEIAAHLQSLNAEGITLCLVEHDMPLIRQLCGHVVVMAEGRTLVTGSFDEVVAHPEVQEAYLGHRA
ncbi:ABC transporter ATP-binding protein [Roseomonas sp. GC11]|uniref:ABC transporter ATP-binding protein n=1 Tax=Roseomonas sp. GC11 TaxID=2950546 RepID=UPI00210BC32B|nr:ABC transporter ATP-binding protein [Roseomonas sp. GC11]MCQ4160082.1 ABC transporter ATP-binding protein [Roseomonas sp. GC11]